MSNSENPPPQIGSTCKDGGKCHHYCTAQEGCFRQKCCVPLSSSGLDDQWNTPEESANIFAEELRQTHSLPLKKITKKTL